MLTQESLQLHTYKAVYVLTASGGENEYELHHHYAVWLVLIVIPKLVNYVLIGRMHFWSFRKSCIRKFG